MAGSRPSELSKLLRNGQMQSRAWQHAAQQMHVSAWRRLSLSAPVETACANRPVRILHAALPFPSLDRCATASLSAISSGIAPALLPILNPRSAGTQRQDRGLPSPAPHTAAPPSPKIRRPSTFFFFLFRFLLTSVPIWYILVSKMYTQAGSQPAQRPLPTILWAVLSLYPCDRTTQLEPFQSKITPTTRTISDSDTPAAAKISNLHNQKKKG